MPLSQMKVSRSNPLQFAEMLECFHIQREAQLETHVDVQEDL